MAGYLPKTFNGHFILYSKSKGMLRQALKSSEVIWQLCEHISAAAFKYTVGGVLVPLTLKLG